MKQKILFFTVLFCCCSLCYAQQVVSSGGSTAKSEISFNWVLGGDLFQLSTSNNPLPQIESLMSLKVYPNPAIDFINVEVTPADTGQIVLELYSSTGVKIYYERFSLKPTIQVDISDLPSGAYFLKAYSPLNKMFFGAKEIIK